MRQNILYFLAAFGISSTVNAATVVKIHDFNDSPFFHTTYRGSGAFYSRRTDALIHGAIFSESGDRVKVREWKQKVYGVGAVADANDRYLVEVNGDDEDSGFSWFMKKITVRDSKNGVVLWEKPVEGLEKVRDVRLVPFSGDDVVAFQTETGYDFFDAKDGHLVSGAVLPREVSAIKFARWGAWSGPGSIWSDRQSNQSIYLSIEPDGTVLWAFPGGIVAATQGDQTKWIIDQKYRSSESSSASSITAFVSDLKVTAQGQMLVAYRSTSDTASSGVVVIDVKTGQVLKTMAHGTGVAFDQKNIYIRHTRSVAAYDINSLEARWETSGIKTYKENSGFLADDKYVYAIAASLEDEDDPATASCAARRAQELVVMEKSTGKKVSSYKLSNMVEGFYFGSGPHSVIVNQSSYRHIRLPGELPEDYENSGCRVIQHSVALRVAE